MKSSNWKDVAELIGITGVVASLILVAFELRQNTNAVMVANHQALVALDQATTDWFKDPDFAAAYIVALDDVAKLSAAQQAQMISYYADKFNAWEFAFLTHGNGMMEDNIWNGWDGHYRTFMQQSGGRMFWAQGRKGFSPSFRTYVDSISVAPD